MANRLYGEARLMLADERELTLRFDFNALCEAEDAADTSTEAMMKSLAGGSPRLRLARALLYGALRHYHPEINLEDAGELFMSDSEVVSKALGEAMQEMSVRKGAAGPRKGAGNGRTPSRGIGTRSSRLGSSAA